MYSSTPCFPGFGLRSIRLLHHSIFGDHHTSFLLRVITLLCPYLFSSPIFFQNLSVSALSPTIRLQVQLTLPLILALQLHPFHLPCSNRDVLDQPPFSPIVPPNPEKKFRLLSSLLSYFSSSNRLSILSPCAIPFFFLMDILVFSVSLTSSRNFLSTLNAKMKVPICSG